MRFSILTLLGLAFLVFACSQRPEKMSIAHLLPDVNSIQSMTVEYSDPEDESSVQHEFAVPQSYWKPILSSLSRARVDSDPSKWMYLAEVHVTQKDGSKPYLAIYWLPHHEEGAFSAGPSHDSRIYYRGGNSREIAKLLRAAHGAAKSSVTSDPEPAEHLQQAK